MVVVLESIAVSGNYPGEVTLPTGIVAGDLLLALVFWEYSTADPIDGFTSIASNGSEWEWTISQYRIADGSESSSIVPDPNWAIVRSVVARISGVDVSDPVNVAGVPGIAQGASSPFKTVELDSISPDVAGTVLTTMGIGNGGNIPDGITLDGDAFEMTATATATIAGVTLELLGSSGATGTRTIVSNGPGSFAYGVMGALVALNPAGGGEPEPDPPARSRRLGLFLPV